MILYQAEECTSREDDGKLMYWPRTGYPRSHYECVILPNPREEAGAGVEGKGKGEEVGGAGAPSGIEWVLQRVNCLWAKEGRTCEVRAGDTRLCWGRWRMGCPRDLPTDLRRR